MVKNIITDDKLEGCIDDERQ